jgi:hypothetical protein
LNEESISSAKTPFETRETPKPWVEPVLLKLEAGMAETGSLYGADSTVQTS